ncbi:MAG: NfeD family protein [Candidatus Dependentiae bacterium]|nr:NfeD family protein [Candidatus Dependentiae bacterium]
MIDNIQLLWFSLIFLFLFLEMGHPGLLYFLSFSCGALCSFVATLYGACVPSQLILFIAGTCSALLIVHFLVIQKKNQLEAPSHRSNIDALIGKKVIVYQSEQDSNVWQAKIFGQTWPVKTIHNEPLSQGQQVVIVDVQGCHLRVDSIK